MTQPYSQSCTQLSQSTQFSQSTPLPTDLPFQIVSKTIGRGAYASVKKGRTAEGEVFAVKFIHKPYAFQSGRITEKQLQTEAALHQKCGRHPNLIEFYAAGEDETWMWIAMEYADGGDLFDKIESDHGVPEDVAHFYFTQLVSGLSYIHGEGIAHRDLKPENILLDAKGNLKIADFGLAMVYQYKGTYRTSRSLVGSPPYVAPEVLEGSYRGDRVDVWSSAIVLYVLLAGNTPWDEPTSRSPEYKHFVETGGRPRYEPWPSLPIGPLSLIRGMMRLDQESRFTLADIRRHPWFTRPNPYMAANGLCSDSLNLAAKLMENLRIDFNKSSRASGGRGDGAGDLDFARMSATQPQPGPAEIVDWERPAISFASQPTETDAYSTQDPWDSILEDPSMTQFVSDASHDQSVVSLTQKAKKFNDICPPQRLTRFYSPYGFRQLLPVLAGALHQRGVVVPEFNDEELEEGWHDVWIPVRTFDSRRCVLRGDVVVERIGEGVLQVVFSKSMGDPVEWRRFFKDVVVAAREAVYTGK